MPERVSHGTFTALGAAAAGYRLTLLVPSIDISLLAAQVPSSRRQYLHQALPYALEEQLAADVETLHFAIANTRPGTSILCAVLAKATLRNWLGKLAAVGLKPDVAIPDVLALPQQSGQWSLLLEANSAYLRTGPYSGLACDTTALSHLLPQLIQQSGEQRPQRIIINEIPSAGTEQTRQELERYCKEMKLDFTHATIANALPMMARATLAATPINLLQGDFSRRKQTQQLWRPWRAAAALLTLLLLIQGGITTSRYTRLSHQEQQLNEQIENIYRQSFPESRRIVNVRAQMEQGLQALRSGSGMQELPQLLLHAGPALHRPDIELRALQYTPEQFTIELTARNLQALDQLKQTLESEVIHAEILQADSSHDQIAGRIAIRMDKP